MNILAISQPTSGCGYHRVVLPMSFMDDIKGYITNSPDEKMLSEKYDIFYFNRITQFDGKFDELRNKLGCKIVMDIDDSWFLPSNHLNYHDYLHINLRIETNIIESDLVTCTNERLAELIYQFNKNVEIIPNAIPFGLHQFTHEKNESDKLRLFWCGSITHEGDLEILKNPIRRLNAINDKIQMVIGGYDDGNELSKMIWERMVSYFTNSRSLNYQILRGTTPDKYMSMYSNADIMLIPLLKSDWASCKSNLKILEASVKGVPVICQAVEPYTRDVDAPVLWVKNQTDWNKHLNFLINNEKERINYGKEIQNYCREKYDMRKVNEHRRKTFENLVGSQRNL